MRNVLKLSWKMLKRNKLLNTYIIIQMAVVFSMTIFMVSSVVTRFKYYEPFKKYIDKGGWFYDLGLSDSGAVFLSHDDAAEKLDGIDADDFHFSYHVSLYQTSFTGREYSAFAYDEEMYINYKPRMKDGKWLSELDDKYTEGETPVVMYDHTNTIKIGDIIETGVYVYDPSKNSSDKVLKKLRVVGLLNRDSKVVFYNSKGEKDCNSLYSSIEYIIERKSNEDVYLFREKDARREGHSIRAEGPAFINVSNNLSEEAYTKNKSLLDNSSNVFIELDELEKNSIKFIILEVQKLMPIFVCILLLTLIITVSVNAITTYKEITNFALYYICGITWKKTMLISFIHAVIQTVLALFTAIIGMSICSAASLLSNTVLEFHPLQILVCLAMICVNLIFAFIMPFIIIRNNTPKEILTSN